MSGELPDQDHASVEDQQRAYAAGLEAERVHAGQLHDDDRVAAIDDELARVNAELDAADAARADTAAAADITVADIEEPFPAVEAAPEQELP